MKPNPSRRTVLKAALSGAAALPTGLLAEAVPTGALATSNDREAWLNIVERISTPVLEAIAKNQLRATMPIECVAGQIESRRECTHLEAVGRLLCGIAPWLELEGCTGSEAALQSKFRDLARK